MNKYVKTIVGILIVLVPVVLLLGFLLNKLTQKSFYSNSGEVHISGINSQVKIYSDEYSVPHIIANTEHDMYFALGYMHAQDRLWQMDLTRRVAEGRLSEIFGSSTIDFDKLFRTIGISKYAYHLKESISPKSKEILEAYSEGVNRFIENHFDKLPAEFDILNYKPDEWKPEHSLMLIRMMGWEMNLSWFTDYVMGEMIDKAGIEKISEIFPDTNISIYKKVQPIPDSLHADTLKPISMHNDRYSGYKKPLALGKDFFETNRSFREYFDLGFDYSASNCWAVSGQRSESGKPILANDPHLILMAPSRWYEVHLKDKNIDVTGMSLPGVPGIAIGHNRAVCWGITNLMNDDNDYIIFEKDPVNQSAYKYKNQTLQLDSINEKIKVKDSSEVYYTIKYTISGPVISDLKTKSLIGGISGPGVHQNQIMTFKWTGFEFSDEISSFYKINTSKDWEEFRNALKEFGTPGLNFIYADTAGNIGYQAAGKVPIRRSNTYNYIYPSTEEPEWTEFVEFEKMPFMFNPKEGYLATANTNPFDWLKIEPRNRFYISYGWAPSSRLATIKDYLMLRNKFNPDEFKLLQLSEVSNYAKMFSQYIIEAYKDHPAYNGKVNEVVDRFKNWNFVMDHNEPMGTIYNVFLAKLIKNLYLPKFGERVFEDFLLICNIPLNMTIRVLSDPNSGWLDTSGGSYAEKRNSIIRQSMTETIDELNARFNDSPVDFWRWGTLHMVKFVHPLGIVSALDRTFNIGPYEVGGDQTTVNNSTYSFADAYKKGTYDDVVGTSMRMITDLSDMDHTFSVNSTGQSGQPLHPNYEDQSRLWVFGDYKIVIMNESEMVHDKYKLLLLIPQN